jgi:hypothetical protein
VWWGQIINGDETSGSFSQNDPLTWVEVGTESMQAKIEGNELETSLLLSP